MSTSETEDQSLGTYDNGINTGKRCWTNFVVKD